MCLLALKSKYVHADVCVSVLPYDQLLTCPEGTLTPTGVRHWSKDSAVVKNGSMNKHKGMF